jgi:hypothetical protein
LAGFCEQKEDISQEDEAKAGRRQHGRCETENEDKTQTRPWFHFWNRAENIQ